MSDKMFPVFDLSDFESANASRRRALAGEVDSVCRATGFLAVSGHGVAQDVVDAAWSKARAFFELPPEQKQRARAPYPGYPYGYLGPELEALARSRDVDAPPDLKESFNGGPARAPEGVSDPEALAFCYAATIWPEAPEGFREAWQAYYHAMEDLAARIMRVFALALQLDEDYFEPYIDAPISALRALNYPRQQRTPKPGRIRAGAHTDYGSLTILLPEPGSRGTRNSVAAGPLDAYSPAARRFRHQHRRSDGALDQRPLGLDPAPRRQPVARAGRRRAPAVDGVLPSTQLGRRNPRPGRVPRAW